MNKETKINWCKSEKGLGKSVVVVFMGATYKKIDRKMSMNIVENRQAKKKHLSLYSLELLSSFWSFFFFPFFFFLSTLLMLVLILFFISPAGQQANTIDYYCCFVGYSSIIIERQKKRRRIQKNFNLITKLMMLIETMLEYKDYTAKI